LYRRIFGQRVGDATRRYDASFFVMRHEHIKAVSTRYSDLLKVFRDAGWGRASREALKETGSRGLKVEVWLAVILDKIIFEPVAETLHITTIPSLHRGYQQTDPLFRYRSASRILSGGGFDTLLGGAMLRFISVFNVGTCAFGNINLTRTLLTAGLRKSVPGGLALAIMVFGSSVAHADCTVGGAFGTINNAAQFFSFGSLVGGALGTTVNSANTAFLTQSTAFVGSPANARPDEGGGGVWVRGVAGEVSDKSASAGNGTITTASGPQATGPISCSDTFHQEYAGVQVGQDISRLNINGWNLHFGATAGSLESRGTLQGSTFNSDISVPFLGSYIAVSNGGFFADALVRGDFYQANFNSPENNIFNQNLNARGLTLAGSAGYRYDVPNSNWFIEPSGGLIWSRVTVDPFNVTGASLVSGLPPSGPIQGTVQLNDIESTIGRLGVRFGETFESGGVYWQPFAAVSVWTDFRADSRGNYASCGTLTGGDTCALYTNSGGVTSPAIGSSTFTNSGIGTYGQYSLGIAGQVANTGWLGFARVDLRDGEHLEGVSGTGGIRYQFTPEFPIAAKLPIYKATPVSAPYSWTGLYVGGFLGADRGWSHEDWQGVGGIGDIGPKPQGAIGGGQVGYNYQIGTWLIGIEGDFGATNTKGSTACTDLSNPFGNGSLWNMTCSAEANWIATIAGRLGAVWDRTLYYVKGGAAFAHETFSANCNLGPLNGSSLVDFDCFSPNLNNLSPLNVINAADTRVGETFGVGTEFALTRNWSAKAEWDYTNFGSRSLVASDGTIINAGMSLNEVKIGANYHFGP
jgi:opacity protein-like surface antigen